MNKRLLLFIVGAIAFLLALVLTLLLTTTTARAQNLHGSYTGKLNAGVAKLTIVLNISADGSATLESPDQTDQTIPAVTDYVSADSVAVSIPALRASYRARLVGNALHGQFRQGTLTLPLTLKAGTVERRRPQTPVAPFPYKTEEVTFTNERDGAILAGTLSVPDGATTVLLMVTGSGQQNRDEELMGHKPFAVIADRLARSGIATLRYDDRATAQSVGGNVADATTEDFACDAEAGISYLRQSGRFARVGILGHSEGGTIAFMLGAKRQVDFVVSLAAPAVSGDSIVWRQLQAMGMGDGISVEQVRMQQQTSGQPWLQFFSTYDPSTSISNTVCPVFAVNGTKDVQVDAAMNLGALRRLLPANTQTVIHSYDGLNHLFQHCTTGLPAEYGDIEETIAEELLRDMTEWIKNL